MNRIGEELVEEGALDLEGLTTGLRYGAVVAVFLIGAGLGYKQYTKKQARRFLKQMSSNNSCCEIWISFHLRVNIH